ncbi:MAG TPA: malonic semialdehyde reductase [Hyphomicrobiaceae bacterium]|nr:malonic semialdehyde reductase [Hyphomicrobiaceae bacterium]
MTDAISDAALTQILVGARSHNAWLPRPVDPAILRQLIDVMKMGPTSANCSPARIRFVTTPAAKERLLKYVSDGNSEKTRSAPVTAIVAFDLDFHEQLPKLFPHTDARSWFTGNEALIEETAFRNSSLQGAYLIIAARALGLDAGPMSGFDKAGVDAEFFAGTSIKSNFLCNLGYGDAAGLFERSPRFTFAEMAEIL